MNIFQRTETRNFLLLLACLLLTACRIEIDVPTSGEVVTSSGAIQCGAGELCYVEVNDIFFDETFEAVPAEGFEFKGWKTQDRGLCGGSTAPCRLVTSGAADSEPFMAIIENPNEEFYLHPEFQSTGFNALFIGHSFFRPFAEGMPDHADRSGIDNHQQEVVFAGGPNGAPEALWNNSSKREEIQSILNAGDVELFVMTYHPDYPTLTGYRNWIDYALEQNADTRIAVAMPWGTYPEDFDTSTYESLWEAYYAGEYADGIDALRRMYPQTELFSIPYGQSAIELRKLLDAGELPEVENMTSADRSGIYTDQLGHAGDILIELGRLVWLRAIYGIDLEDYPYESGYSVDLREIATVIMDEHDPEYDAPYR